MARDRAYWERRQRQVTDEMNGLTNRLLSDEEALRVRSLNDEEDEIEEELRKFPPWTDEDEAALEDFEERKRRRIAEENEY